MVDIGMFGKRCTRFRAKPGHHIERADRQTSLFGNLRKFQYGQAGFLGRLDHGCIAHGQRCAKAATQNLHRIVPRNDMPRDPMRLIDRQNRKAVLIGQRVAMHLVGGSAVKLEITRQRHHIGAGLSDRLADIFRFQIGQEINVLQHFFRHAVQHTTALGRRQLAPIAGKRATGRSHRQIDISLGAARNQRKIAAVGRIFGA